MGVSGGVREHPSERQVSQIKLTVALAHSNDHLPRMLQVLLLIEPELQYEDHSHVEIYTNRIGSWQSMHAGLNLWSLRRCHQS